MTHLRPGAIDSPPERRVVTGILGVDGRSAIGQRAENVDVALPRGHAQGGRGATPPQALPPARLSARTTSAPFPPALVGDREAAHGRHDPGRRLNQAWPTPAGRVW